MFNCSHSEKGSGTGLTHIMYRSRLSCNCCADDDDDGGDGGDGGGCSGGGGGGVGGDGYMFCSHNLH